MFMWRYNVPIAKKVQKHHPVEVCDHYSFPLMSKETYEESLDPDGHLDHPQNLVDC